MEKIKNVLISINTLITNSANGLEPHQQQEILKQGFSYRKHREWFPSLSKETLNQNRLGDLEEAALNTSASERLHIVAHMLIYEGFTPDVKDEALFVYVTLLQTNVKRGTAEEPLMQANDASLLVELLQQGEAKDCLYVEGLLLNSELSQAHRQVFFDTALRKAKSLGEAKNADNEQSPKRDNLANISKDEILELINEDVCNHATIQRLCDVIKGHPDEQIGVWALSLLPAYIAKNTHSFCDFKGVIVHALMSQYRSLRNRAHLLITQTYRDEFAAWYGELIAAHKKVNSL